MKRIFSLALLLAAVAAQANASTPAPHKRIEIETAIYAGDNTQIRALIHSHPWLATISVLLPAPISMVGSLLHLAATNSIPSVVRMLCASGLALDECVQRGHTALGLAAHFKTKTENALTLIDFYKSKGIPVDLHNAPAPTPFLVAAYYGNVRLANALYVAGANITAVDDENNTALLYAVKNNQEDFVAWFIALPEASAVLHATDNDGLNALDYAVKENFDSVTAMLTEAGATHSEKYTQVLRDGTSGADLFGYCIMQ